MKKLSIAIAVLNAAEALKATLASVNDHLPAGLVDVIIADGGSTDGGAEWLLKEQPAAHIILGPDAGIYDAMNQMVRRSGTSHILFMGAGDLVLPAMAEVLAVLEKTHADSESALHIGGVELDGNRAAGVPALYPARWDSGLWWRHVTHHQGVMYPVQALLKHPYELTFKVLGDYAVDLELFRDGHRATLHPQTVVRAEGGGVSQRFTKALYREEWRVKKGRVPFFVLIASPIWLVAKYLYKHFKKQSTA